MKFLVRIVVTATLALAGAGIAQAQATAGAPFGLDQGQAPAVQFAGQYQATHANAPPGGCGCFWFQGGGGQVILSARPRWAAMADVSYAKASQINGTDQNLSVLNYTFGPRYTLWGQGRWSPYGQLLVGLSRVSSNYVIYGSGSNSIAAQAGLGVDYHLRPHYSIVPLEIDWVFSEAANSVNSRQNNIRVGAGIVYRLGPH